MASAVVRASLRRGRLAGWWGAGGRHRSWELPFASRVSAIPHFTEEETELLRERK